MGEDMGQELTKTTRDTLSVTCSNGFKNHSFVVQIE